MKNHNQNKKQQHKKQMTRFALFAIILLFIYSIIFDRSNIGDVLTVTLFFFGLYFFNKQHDFSLTTFYLILLAITLHLLGTLGMYSKFIFLDIIGYDKLVHLTSSFALAYALLEVITEKNKSLRYAMVIFAVIGAGAVVEIAEFIGQHYFGVINGGIFTTIDNLPSINTDLQKYDTYFDMIFNTVGASIALIIVSFNKHKRRN